MNWVEFQETNFDFGKTKLHEIDASRKMSTTGFVRSQFFFDI